MGNLKEKNIGHTRLGLKERKKETTDNVFEDSKKHIYN